MVAAPDSQETITGQRRSLPRRPPPSGLADGRFEILGTLGEGGMGEVFRAHDVELDREVALKRLKAWVLDDRARSRLAREAQAMAQLSHPNVIEVYGVELDDDFVLVMELVKGPTLGEWLTAAPRAWTEVLSIFVQAGRGLAAAHRAGLVHRDFKPSNVMLGEDGRVRVMDFGLAQPHGASATGERSAGSLDALASSSASHPREEALTATGMVVGTPAYMAPEQFQALAADGRADQYAFCVALWQALCRERPFQGNYVEIGRAKYRGPPPWPKAVVVPRRLAAAIRRGLAPEAEARWPSMEALLVELEAAARPGTRRGLVAVGAVTLLGGTVAAVVVMQPVTAPACESAEALQRALWDEGRRETVEGALLGTQTAYAAATWERVGPALDAYASAWASASHAACESTRSPAPGDATVDARVRCLQSRRRSFEALVEALGEADHERVAEASTAVERLPSLAACEDPKRLEAALPLPEDAVVATRVVELRERLARAEALRGVARCEDATAVVAEVAAEIRTLGFGPLGAELRLAEGLVADCAADYERAEAGLREAYFLASELRHQEVAAQAALELMHVVGVEQERHEEGMQWGEHARAELVRGGDPAAEASYLEQLGSLYHAAGRYDEAIASYERGLGELVARGGTDTNMHAVFLGNLGSALRVVGRFEEARARHEQSLAITERLVGPDHPDITRHLVNLANVHNDLGEPERAEALIRRALARAERDLGASHPSTLQVMGNLALTLSIQGRGAEAIPLHERVIAGMEQTLGAEHPNIAMGLNNLGIDQLGMGDVEGALRSHRRALEIREQSLGPEHMLTVSSVSNLADAQLVAGEHEAARLGYARALPVMEQAVGAESPMLSYPLVGLGRALMAGGDASTALPLLERGLALREQGHAPAAELCEARFETGRALWQSGGDRRRATELVRAAVEVARELEGAMRPRDEAEAWLREHVR